MSMLHEIGQAEAEILQAALVGNLETAIPCSFTGRAFIIYDSFPPKEFQGIVVISIRN